MLLVPKKAPLELNDEGLDVGGNDVFHGGTQLSRIDDVINVLNLDQKQSEYYVVIAKHILVLFWQPWNQGMKVSSVS